MRSRALIHQVVNSKVHVWVSDLGTRARRPSQAAINVNSMDRLADRSATELESGWPQGIRYICSRYNNVEVALTCQPNKITLIIIPLGATETEQDYTEYRHVQSCQISR
jgi:hypothetical protein